METKVKENGQAKAADTVNAKKAPQFVAGNPVNAESKKAEETKEAKPLGGEPSKINIKNSITEKIAEQRAILERHIKLGDNLARMIRYRDNLTGLIATLDHFEIALKNGMEELENNQYQGCSLTITDDKGNSFSVRNSAIIKVVAEKMNDLFADKLKEVETDIVNLIPA
ncbi:MAG: hypothetical protein EOO90_21705 [Pedobacter sp.]|nr:MAG: hypothetical protein EOO90_21705 [Pedobacter sp.]